MIPSIHHKHIGSHQGAAGPVGHCGFAERLARVRSQCASSAEELPHVITLPLIVTRSALTVRLKFAQLSLKSNRSRCADQFDCPFPHTSRSRCPLCTGRLLLAPLSFHGGSHLVCAAIAEPLPFVQKTPSPSLHLLSISYLLGLLTQQPERRSLVTHANCLLIFS